MGDIIRRLREPPFGTETSERNLMAAAADEIERLRAGGCARDQTTTQFCAEAAVLQAENVRLREALKDARNNGLIYWEPRTERGHVSKAQMLSRIDAALAEEENKS